MLEKEVEAIQSVNLHSLTLKDPGEQNWTSYQTESGQCPSGLEQLRQQIFEEVRKTKKNLPFIKKMMQTTFALRWQTIVNTCPPVKEFMDLWPALKMESEVKWISSLFPVFPLMW